MSAVKQKNAGRLGVLVILLLFLLSSFSGCDDSEINRNPILVLNLAGGASNYEAKIEIEMYPDKAPNTVKNIIYLVQQGFYDGLKVNLALEDTFIEFSDGMGLATLRETGDIPRYAIRGEFAANGFEGNDIPFERGTVAMSRYEKGDYDSAVDGFFITLGNLPEADGNFAAFGKVVSGIEAVQEISRMKTTDASLHYEPVYSVVIEKASVILKGITYEKPTGIARTYSHWNSYDLWWVSDKADATSTPIPNATPA